MSGDEDTDTPDTNSKASEGAVEGTIKAATGLVKAVPIYQDAIQPAAKELGRSLETVTKAVNVALAPVTGLIWGYEKIKDFVDNLVSEKLQNVPEENIITPPPHIAGPALESLRYSGNIEELREMYANLIASSMDKNTTNDVHPAYNEIIKQITSKEALLLSAFKTNIQLPIITVVDQDNSGDDNLFPCTYFTNLPEMLGLDNNDMVPTFIDNMIRLGVLEVPHDAIATNAESIYEELENHPFIVELRNSIDATDGRQSNIVKKTALITSLGKNFVQTCVQDHREIGSPNKSE
ncbi:MAG: DUF4393 domain-containing protein [Rhodospirillaceae bacterium]|jgi:hypothetical protein|nr:DUF4393 domain-containing protein [Rhodospirillaceae bacterium]MBT4487563.1 DUF4393 domain-containing protein [Rhodospirillaceae bacterium]MBT5048891.1 DUF4393 domain-containing protein [Rhodospirillaceae bacterium]MBT5895989.1 DUF4393 domain-containing protein [Rhodospirillaceae bacterium]MBT6430663.1 DUF4393 domain-containing protein [Rhodospirillaceae bacterium]